MSIHKSSHHAHQQLMYILGCGDYDEIIAWSLNGESVIVKDTHGFAESVLPIFFKQSKFDSFTRKMRRWGFSTRRLHMPKGLKGTSFAFQHPRFTKAGGFDMCYKVVTSTTHAVKTSEFVNQMRREGRIAAAPQDIRQQDCTTSQSSSPADTIRQHVPQENNENMYILQPPPLATSAAFLLENHRQQLYLRNLLSAAQENDHHHQARRIFFMGHEMIPPDTFLGVHPSGVRNEFSRSPTMPSLHPYQSISDCGPQFFRQDVGMGQRVRGLSSLSDSTATPAAAGATHDNMFGMLNNDNLAYKRQLMLELLSSFP